MNDQAQEEISPVRLLAAWAAFGTRMIGRLEMGMLHTDLHEGNFGMRRGSDDVVVLDYGGIRKIDYPKDCSLVPVALMSLLEWLNVDRTAAFRFGFLTQGGPVAQAIFDDMRRRYDFHAFIEETMLTYEPPAGDGDGLSDPVLQEADRRWRTQRGMLKLGDKVDRNPDLDDLNHWRGERDRNKLGLSDADEFYYRRHLIAAAYHQSLEHMLEVLLNLQGFYEVTGRLTEAVGVGHFASRLVDEFASGIDPEFAIRIKENHVRLIGQLPAAAIAVFDLIPTYPNVFYHLWAMDDALQGILRPPLEST